MNGPNERTVEAGARGALAVLARLHEDAEWADIARGSLGAAMSPDLGPDRLVTAGEHREAVVREVVDWLRTPYDGPDPTRDGPSLEAAPLVADEIEARFLSTEGTGE